MAILGNVGKKISDAGQSVAKQTKDTVEISRLNGEIAKKEQETMQLFARLGMAYYSKWGDNLFADYNEQMAEIRKRLQEIEQDKAAVKRLKGIVPCPKCGADLAPGDSFCIKCGTRVVQPPKAAAGRCCSQCGEAAPEGDSFCMHCGAMLD